MLESNGNSQNIESAELLIEKFEDRVTSSVIDKYIAKVKAKDIEQIKVYLGIIYFFALTFLSISLLM